MAEKFKVNYETIEDPKSILKLVAENKGLIVDELTSCNITAIKTIKDLILVKGNKKMTITVTDEALGKENYNYTFINKVKVMTNGNSSIYLYIAYSKNEDFRAHFKADPIGFIKALNGYPIYDTTMTCINISNEVNNFIK